MNMHDLTVAPEQAGTRLDKFLADALPELSRARCQQLLAEGCVSRLGSVVTSGSAKVKAAERYSVQVPEIKPLDLTPEPIALDILFEDASLLIINKPVGMTVHPAPGARHGTLVHALLAHCGSTLSGIGGVARPGIVHRIDKDTSGLLAVAKTDEAHRSLSAQLKDRSLKRHYRAYGWGSLTPREGEIDAPLARNPRFRKQMAVVESGRHALTHYRTDALYIPAGSIQPLASAFTCALDTGRTHQIRVHLAYKKCPLIGDALYGPAAGTKLNRLRQSHTGIATETLQFLTHFPRQALHAQELALLHPESGEPMRFFAPIPADLEALEHALVSLTNAGKSATSHRM